MRSVRRQRYLGCLTLCLALGCGDNLPRLEPDAGPPVRSLDIVEPASGELGLAFDQVGTLRVRYHDRQLGALPGETVRFTLVADPARGESAAGATLSASAALTDADGIAAIQVVSGAAVGNFRVEATAPSAPTATLYVAVTDQGFTSLRATPRHVGDRPLAHFAAVEVRLYRATACGELSALAPPPSVYAPRTFSGFDAEAGFDAVGAGVAHALLVWGEDDAHRVLAEGCLELSADRVRAGGRVFVDVPVIDRPAALASAYAVASTLDLAPLRAAIAGAGSPWAILRCPRGPAQLFLDATLAELAPSDPTAVAVAAARGTLDAQGCRSATRVDGAPSADAEVEAALESSGTSPAARLKDAALTLVDLLDRLLVESTLAPDDAAAVHRLEALSLDIAGQRHRASAVASPRPIVAATIWPARVGSRWTLPAHGFTARLGWLARDAFVALVLAPAGLGSDVSTLATPVATSAVRGPYTGCRAISDAACLAAGLASTCLETACAAALPGLDAALAAPFFRLDATGVDLQLQGVATLADDDHDLAVEAIKNGLWSASFRLADGTDVSVSGSFSATP